MLIDISYVILNFDKLYCSLFICYYDGMHLNILFILNNHLHYIYYGPGIKLFSGCSIWTGSEKCNYHSNCFFFWIKNTVFILDKILMKSHMSSDTFKYKTKLQLSSMNLDYQHKSFFPSSIIPGNKITVDLWTLDSQWTIIFPNQIKALLSF